MNDAEFAAELNDGLRSTLERMHDWSFFAAGQDWWNMLSVDDRRKWLEVAGLNASVADAYNAYLRDKYPPVTVTAAAADLGIKSPCCGLDTTPEFKGQEMTYDVCPCGKKRLRA